MTTLCRGVRADRGSDAVSDNYHKRWRLDRERGVTRTVPAAPVAERIATLLAAGLTKRGIAELAGVSVQAIVKIPKQQTTRRTTAVRILRVQPGDIRTRCNPAGYVPALGSRRRIEALMALGWSHRTISEHLRTHGSRQTSQGILHQAGELLECLTAAAVTATFDKLAMSLGTSSRSRSWAKKNGYAPPLAWDDIDDPDAHPDVGEIVARQGTGGRPVDLDEFAFLVRCGERPERAADDKRARDVGRDDILQLIARKAVA